MNFKTTFMLAAIAAAITAIGIATPIMQAYAAGSASSAATGDRLGTASAGSGSRTGVAQGSAASAGAFGTAASGGDQCEVDGARADDGGCSRAD